MSRDYAHEEWIPWYTRATAGWLDLSLAARGVAVGIAMLMGRDGTEIPLGSRGLRGLARLLGCSWDELEGPLRELLSPGPDGEPPRLVHDEARGVISDPEASARRRPTSTDRVQRHRSKKPSQPDETRETVSSVSQRDETGASVPSPSLLISSGSSSGRSDPPVRSGGAADPALPPPDWWDGVLATVAMGTGVDLPRAEAWIRYAGHRGGKGEPPTATHASYWLTTVMVAEARDKREQARRQADRDAKFDRARAGPPNPADAQKLSEAEQREIAARVPMRRRGAA